MGRLSAGHTLRNDDPGRLARVLDAKARLIGCVGHVRLVWRWRGGGARGYRVRPEG